MSNEDISKLVEFLTNRSKRARRSAWLATILIVITVFALIVFFYGVPISSDVEKGINSRIFDLLDESTRTGEANALLALGLDQQASNDKTDQLRLQIESKKIDLELKRLEIIKSTEAAISNTIAITDAVTKIGAVFIAIYLVQILLSLMRYHFKLADHIESVAESIMLSKGNLEKLEKTSNIIGISHIDFGKAPQTPIDKLAGIIKELGEKVANISPNK